MHSSFALAALAAVAFARPQGVAEGIAPSAPAPAGCSPSFNGKFNIATINITSSTKRDVIQNREESCGAKGALVVTLSNGILTDAMGRIGSIVANHQFQFDGPPQAGAIYTGGFSACSNSTLALGGSSVFYQCLSGSFYNIYDRSIGKQCTPVVYQIIPCSGATTPAPSNGAGQIGDGQPTGAVGGKVTQIGDGQVSAPTGAPKVGEASDGQLQMPHVSQIGDGQVQAPTGAPVSQISDGQVQAPTSAVAPVTQIGDGQVQAPTGAPVTQISDGQIQAPTSTVAPVVSQISDGQVQAPTATATPTAVVSQITDGQIQAPTAVVSQIGDGQVQAPSGAPAPVNGSQPTTPAQFVGAGSKFMVSSSAAGILGMVAILGMFI